MNGTNLQVIGALVAGPEGLVVGQAALFLVKNRIKSVASDLFTLEGLV